MKKKFCVGYDSLFNSDLCRMIQDHSYIHFEKKKSGGLQGHNKPSIQMRGKVSL